jgi:hypothetical protein
MRKLTLSNTFSEAEVVALDKLLAKIREGGSAKDCAQLVKDPALTSAHGKFLRMREKAQRSAS